MTCCTNSQSVVLCQYQSFALRFRCHSRCACEPTRSPSSAIRFVPTLTTSRRNWCCPRSRRRSAEFKGKRVDWWIAQLKRARVAEQERERALEKLKQSERRLAEAQQVAHIGSWERDLRTNQVTWSDELYRLFGLQGGRDRPLLPAVPEPRLAARCGSDSHRWWTRQFASAATSAVITESPSRTAAFVCCMTGEV